MAENIRMSEEARFRRIVVHDDLEDAREGLDPPDLNLPDRSQDVRDLIVRISKVWRCNLPGCNFQKYF